MVVLAPHGASDTYGQLSDIGADTMRAPRYSSTPLTFFTVHEIEVVRTLEEFLGHRESSW